MVASSGAHGRHHAHTSAHTSAHAQPILPRRVPLLRPAHLKPIANEPSRGIAIDAAHSISKAVLRGDAEAKVKGFAQLVLDLEGVERRLARYVPRPLFCGSGSGSSSGSGSGSSSGSSRLPPYTYAVPACLAFQRDEPLPPRLVFHEVVRPCFHAGAGIHVAGEVVPRGAHVAEADSVVMNHLIAIFFVFFFFFVFLLFLQVAIGVTFADVAREFRPRMSHIYLAL